MAKGGDGRRWTRDELLVAFNLYLRLPYGQLHQGNGQIIELAGRLGRTPGSVGFKLNNFASLDPMHQRRGIKGLQNVSRLDREVFEEFSEDWPRLALESEEARERLGVSGGGIALPGDGGIAFPGDVEAGPAPGVERTRTGETPMPPAEGAGEAPAGPESQEGPPAAPWEQDRPTEAFATVKQRRLQSLFRLTVLASYDNTCAISGIAGPKLLQASHIVPWAADTRRRLDPRNGLALSALHDRAFDRGLITLDENLRVLIAPELRVAAPSPLHRQALLEIEGREIRLPTRWAPDLEALAWHRERVFVG